MNVPPFFKCRINQSATIRFFLAFFPVFGRPSAAPKFQLAINRVIDLSSRQVAAVALRHRLLFNQN